MSALENEHCVPITSGTRPIDERESKDFLTDLSDWKTYTKEAEPRLEKSYKFDDFVQAMSFTNQVAEVSNKENHHPAITTEYGKVTIDWWTHKIKGLHRNDFIMAAKCDAIYAKQISQH